MFHITLDYHTGICCQHFFSSLIIFFIRGIIEGVKDTKKERILDIVSEMYDAGIERSFCTSAGELAMDFEGIYDLLVLWSEETDPAERDAIIQDLEDTLEDVMWYDIAAWHDED